MVNYERLAQDIRTASARIPVRRNRGLEFETSPLVGTQDSIFADTADDGRQLDIWIEETLEASIVIRDASDELIDVYTGYNYEEYLRRNW